MLSATLLLLLLGLAAGPQFSANAQAVRKCAVPDAWEAKVTRTESGAPPDPSGKPGKEGTTFGHHYYDQPNSRLAFEEVRLIHQAAGKNDTRFKTVTLEFFDEQIEIIFSVLSQILKPIFRE